MRCLLCSLLLLCCGIVYGQAPADFLICRKNHIYLEGWGPGGFGSINYERKIYCDDWFSMAIRAGISSFPVVDYSRQFNPDLVLPMGFYALFGRSHQLEVGYGPVITNIVRMRLSDYKPARYTDVHLHSHFGYRFQPTGKRIVLRIGYTPVIDQNHRFIHRTAMSAGYCF